jgi:hypothetical protein
MADREMIAATLTAGVLSAYTFAIGAETTPAQVAVRLYHQVLAQLAASSGEAPVSPQASGSTP